jgi:hypothetical protein
MRIPTLRPGDLLVLAAFACVPMFGCGSNSNSNASSGTSGASSGSTSGSGAASGTTSGAGSGASGTASGSASGVGSGASGSSSGVPVEAGSDASEGGSPETGVDASDGGGSEGAALDGGGDSATPDGGVDGGSSNVTLTVMNYFGWCSVSINGGAASTGSSVTASVAPGTAATIVALPASMAFAIGADPWFGVTQNDGGAAPGADNGTGVAETSTAMVVVTGNQCVSVCCGDAPTGTGCPTTNPCQ